MRFERRCLPPCTENVPPQGQTRNTRSPASNRGNDSRHSSISSISIFRQTRATRRGDRRNPRTDERTTSFLTLPPFLAEQGRSGGRVRLGKTGQHLRRVLANLLVNSPDVGLVRLDLCLGQRDRLRREEMGAQADTQTGAESRRQKTTPEVNNFIWVSDMRNLHDRKRTTRYLV